MNITQFFKHMILVHLLKITAITQSFQVVFRCTKIPNCSSYIAFLEVKFHLGLDFTFNSLIVIAFSDPFTTWSNNYLSGAFSINIKSLIYDIDDYLKGIEDLFNSIFQSKIWN